MDRESVIQNAARVRWDSKWLEKGIRRMRASLEREWRIAGTRCGVTTCRLEIGTLARPASLLLRQTGGGREPVWREKKTLKAIQQSRSLGMSGTKSIYRRGIRIYS